MYEANFGLHSDPFRLSPSSRPCYQHLTYRRALAYLTYAVGRRDGVLMLTGYPGTGKSSVVKAFVQATSDPGIVIKQLVCSTLDGDDLLNAIAQQFEVDIDGVKKSIIYERLEQRFMKLHATGRRSLLIVDEAQGLTKEALEELRLLTNFQVGDDVLLQVFLIGQPELKTMVRSPELEQLHQRLIVASSLSPLEVVDVKPYVEHCLTQAGWTGRPVFHDAVYESVHGESQGIPRRVNLIMSRLMLHAMVHELDEVTPEIASLVIDSMREEGLLVSQNWRSQRGLHTEHEASQEIKHESA